MSKKLEKRLGKISRHLSEIKHDLNYHIKRTDLLEKRVDSVWTKALTTLSIISALAILFKQFH